MKVKYLGFIFYCIMPFFCSAQNNIIKTNLLGCAIKNYNITYEKGLNHFFSFSVGFRYMPQIGAPLKNQIEKAVDNSNFKINDFRIGNTAITGEGRFYIGLRKLSGFYIAPYLRYSSFNISMPVNNPNLSDDNPIVFNGKINATSAGLLLGVQHCIFKKIVLDFWIIGGHYGKSTGTLYATDIPLMTQQDRSNLQNELDGFRNVGPFRTSSIITSSTTAEMKTTGPWIGLRSLAFTIGYRF